MIESLIYLVVFGIRKLTEIFYEHKLLFYMAGFLIMFFINWYKLSKHKSEYQNNPDKLRKYVLFNLLVAVVIVMSLFQKIVLAGLILLGLDIVLIYVLLLGVTKANEYIQKRL